MMLGYPTPPLWTMSCSSFLPPITELFGPAKAGLAIASTNANTPIALAVIVPAAPSFP
jgi:hypothetical protein